ncbi:Lcl C-terminal domain-containing protein [Draconibacterium sediminis]|uniref:Lcl C-terminal domain-containing protein n=1 Tax=Draconibacterium sediminis TaxID=1544798 RepID=UPI000B141432|nr:DUF1566 domain-containing protein [Draconibacterium sediminis]
MKAKVIFGIMLLLSIFASCQENSQETIGRLDLAEIAGFPIVGTNQTTSFDNFAEIEKPAVGDPFYGQNSNYPGNSPSYTDNGDGTVTDNVSGLMWQQSFDHNNDGSIDYEDKLSYDEILDLVDKGVSFAGYDDWRLPSIKEMYSLVLFSGKDISPVSTSTLHLTPFIDNETYAFEYGDLNAGERLIDMQCATTTVYVSDEVNYMVFGVNFADGRIKGYGTVFPGGKKKAFNYLLVRGNVSYGINQFQDNGDGTISDLATGLMWKQDDNGEGMLWKDALAYAEGAVFAGYDDWRLPDAKELQSIVDYERSPATTGSAAINPVFNCSRIVNEAGQEDFPWYWSSTTHASQMSGKAAVYVAFGRSLGNMWGWIDIHGAGAQRSDPKIGDPQQFSNGRGPQGDAVRIYNYVRLVRNIK